MKEIPLKVNVKKWILITHLNFILETLIKMNDIEKINALQFYKGNPSKTRQTQKNQKLRIIRKRASQVR